MNETATTSPHSAGAITDDEFTVGQLVWQQMFSPQHPEWTSTIEERVTSGKTYGPRRLMRLRGIIPNYRVDRNGNAVTRWWLSDPDRPNDASGMSYVESDWCVLTDASAEAAMLW